MPIHGDSRNRTVPCGLDNLATLSRRHHQSLNTHWITTLDALVAASATEEGRQGLCRLLDMDSDTLSNVLAEARDLMGEQRYTELKTPVPGRPTGLLLDDAEKPFSRNPPDGE